MDLDTILAAVSQGGTPVLLMIILIGGARGYWVFGSTHREQVQTAKEQLEEMRQDRDYWRNMAFSGTDMANRAVTIAERRVGAGRER